MDNKENKNRNSDKKKNKITFVNICVMVLTAILVLSLGIFLMGKWEQMLIQREMSRVRMEGSSDTFVGIVSILVLCVSAVICMIVYKKLLPYIKQKAAEYDEKVVKKAISEVIPNAEFIRDQCVMPETLREYGIIPFYDAYEKKGMVHYQRNGKNYIFSNIVLLSIREDNDGKRETKTVYSGQVYTAHYKTELPGTVRIFATKRMALTGKETNAGYPSKRKGETKIETENILFNDNFDVYASDEQSAFFILNPIVMEQLLVMKRRYEQVGVYISKDQMVITLKTNQTLFPKWIYMKQKEQETLEKSKEQARSMLRMSELLEDSINGSIRNNFTTASVPVFSPMFSVLDSVLDSIANGINKLLENNS